MDQGDGDHVGSAVVAGPGVWARSTHGPTRTTMSRALPGATDRDITELQQELVQLQADAADPLAPQPRRDRAAAQAAQHLSIIERHRDSATEDGRGNA
ncbi:hypothetical protein ACWCY1_10280 [Streptomyces goshikiensis]|uniref:hypothetical protein n=1 Tax=Streptomyces goshikiensis TaxID=1942 RepID=UPI00167728C9|nr:hypothetical protein [Streptomyces goshikiensis]